MIEEDDGTVARLEALVQEQAALRRVATLVARDVPPACVFESVCEEVGSVLGVTTTNLVRYENDGTASIVGAWALDGAPFFPVASVPLPLDGETVAPRVQRSGRTVRVDDYTDLTDDLAQRLRAVGIRSAIGAPIMVAGRLWGAVIAADARPYSLAPNAETRLSTFAQLITDALANTDAREQLAASRARILKAGDEERRRLGRDLHDGAQQRLVSVVISLQLAQKRWSDEGRARELVDDALDHAQAAIGDLRELAAGIHPSVLTDRGLSAALETLAGRAPVPVDIDSELDDDQRLPMSVETTAYFVVAEALTNIGKYARASRASVGVHVVGDELEIEVLDDGVGGADAAAGSGLRGLADRVAALQGALHVSSPPGRGTRIHARISLD
jgi:signal transduction histidine kinase